MEIFICPHCGKRTMKKEIVGPKKYQLVCIECGFKQAELPMEDKKRGIT